jgi:putative glycerol kinase 5
MTLNGRSFDEFLIFAGMYPLVGWKVGSDLTYLAESASNDTGTVVNWAVQCGK